MRGLLQHLLLTLRLNLRSKQALVYGYLVPVFFLIAFGAIFKTVPPLLHELGQLLTISTLGGACFGMPTAMVAERERGVWRRYRLLPAATGGLIVSTMVARFFIVASAALLQVVLAIAVYHMPAPQYPGQLAVAFVFVAFAFLGLGLVIAMLADTVPAVQALGQSVFLPMIIIGGVGVPLSLLPAWGRHVAGFLPGFYSVEALQACVTPDAARHLSGLADVRFDLAALALIGIAGCLAGGKLFRWDSGHRVPLAARGWALLAVIPWAAVGLVAEQHGRPGFGHDVASNAMVKVLLPPETAPATEPDLATTAPAQTQAALTATQPAHPANWQAITAADIDRVSYDDLEPDSSTVTPVARDFEDLDVDGKKKIDDLTADLADWEPGHAKDVVQRVRNLLAVAAIPDILQDQYESFIPLVVFRQIRLDVPTEDLPKVLTWIIFNREEGTYPTKLPELGWDTEISEDQVRDRCVAYATKLLARVTGKMGKPQ